MEIGPNACSAYHLIISLLTWLSCRRIHGDVVVLQFSTQTVTIFHYGHYTRRPLRYQFQFSFRHAVFVWPGVAVCDCGEYEERDAGNSPLWKSRLLYLGQTMYSFSPGYVIESCSTKFNANTTAHSFAVLFQYTRDNTKLHYFDLFWICVWKSELSIESTLLGTQRYNFQPPTPTLKATMHSVTDRRTDDIILTIVNHYCAPVRSAISYHIIWIC